MTSHRALVVTTPTAASDRLNGGSLRAAAVCAVLQQADFDVTRATARDLDRLSGGWCLGVGVSYAVAGVVPLLRRRAGAVWLDAVDSWLLVNASGLAHGHVSYAARLARDAWRLARMPRVDLLTYISRADMRSDHGTIRGETRLVLPATHHQQHPARPRVGQTRRAVVAGDWTYPPNRDGLVWFRERVLPRLELLVEGLDWQVDVYGDGAPVAGPHLNPLGFVPDFGDLFRDGDVHVVPVRFGAGVKNKAVQPLLAGLPVVATRAGAHGLADHPLLDVRRSPRSFASALATRLHAAAAHVGSSSAPVVDGDDSTALLAWLRHVTAVCSCAAGRDGSTT